jgi:hypothetical protein
MVAVTYGVAAPAVADTKTATNSKGFFTIVLEAIAESQTKRAERELARYRHLLPHDFACSATGCWRVTRMSRSAAGKPRFTSNAAPVIPARGGFVLAHAAAPA